MKEELIEFKVKEKTIDSREVAEMMGKTHGDILKMIQGSGKNLGIIPVLTKGNFHVVDYFIEDKLSHITLVTGKGQIYFVNKFLKEVV